MPRCTKDQEIELSDGTTVECHLKVNGIFDETFNQELGIEEGTWLVDSWSVEHDDVLSDEQQSELDEKVEEIVFAEKWDFETAGDPDDETEDLDE